jgi:hypothetical protein
MRPLLKAQNLETRKFSGKKSKLETKTGHDNRLGESILESRLCKVTDFVRLPMILRNFQIVARSSGLCIREAIEI